MRGTADGGYNESMERVVCRSLDDFALLKVIDFCACEQERGALLIIDGGKVL